MRGVCNSWISILSLVCCLALAMPAFGAPPVAEVEVRPDVVIWSPVAETDGLILYISDPCDVVTRTTWKSGEQPYLEAYNASGQPLDDGSYTWQLYARPIVDPDITKILLQAREEDDQQTVIQLKRDGKLPQGLSQNGYLTVVQGQFVLDDGEEKDFNEANKPAQVDGAGGDAIDFRSLFHPVCTKGQRRVL